MLTNTTARANEKKCTKQVNIPCVYRLVSLYSKDHWQTTRHDDIAVTDAPWSAEAQSDRRRARAVTRSSTAQSGRQIQGGKAFHCQQDLSEMRGEFAVGRDIASDSKVTYCCHAAIRFGDLKGTSPSLLCSRI